MIKRSFVAAALGAFALLGVAPAASAADVQVGPWTVFVPDVQPVLVPIPGGSEAAALPPLPFPFVWDIPFVPAQLPPAPAPAPHVAAPAPARVQAPAATYVKNCTEAWNLGIAPVRRGDAAYRAGLDRDSDGVGCENDPR